MSVPEEITFHDAPVRVGQVTLQTSEEETRMVFALNGPDGQPARVVRNARARNVCREQVMAVRESVAERLRVTFRALRYYVQKYGIRTGGSGDAAQGA